MKAYIIRKTSHRFINNIVRGEKNRVFVDSQRKTFLYFVMIFVVQRGKRYPGRGINNNFLSIVHLIVQVDAVYIFGKIAAGSFNDS